MPPRKRTRADGEEKAEVKRPAPVPVSFYILDKPDAEVELKIDANRHLLVVHEGNTYACSRTFVKHGFTAYYSRGDGSPAWWVCSHKGASMSFYARPLNGTLHIKADGEWIYKQSDGMTCMSKDNTIINLMGGLSTPPRAAASARVHNVVVDTKSRTIVNHF